MFASFAPGHVGINVSLDEGLALAERHGFGGFDAPLEVLTVTVERDGAEAVRAQFLDRGLRVGAWNLPFVPSAVGEEEWHAWLKQLPPLLASAAAVGARRACIWILPGSNALEYADNFEHHTDRLRPVAHLLAEQGIRLGLEFIGPETLRRSFVHPFIHTPAGMLELGHAIGPNCGLLLDSWHWHCVGGTVADLAHLRCGQVVHVHVNDAPLGVPRDELADLSRKLPGATGVIDLDGFMGALADMGYDGPVTAEPFDKSLDALPAEEAAALTAKATRGAVARAVRAYER